MYSHALDRECLLTWPLLAELASCAFPVNEVLRPGYMDNKKAKPFKPCLSLQL